MIIKFILKNNDIIEYNKIEIDKITQESIMLKNYFLHYKTIDYIYLDNIKKETMLNIFEILNGNDFSKFTKMELIDIINVSDFLDMSIILKDSIKYYVLNFITETEIEFIL